MRTLGAGNAAQPTSGLGPNAITAIKIEVANASDVLVDLTENVVSLEYEQTTDEIVDAATIVFRRLSGVNSLAPLMTSSPPVALSRRVVVSLNPGSGAYKEIFRGQIDKVEWPDRDGDVTISCRDQAGVIADTWIEDAVEYGGTGSGVSLETVMQGVATDNLTAPPTLHFPAATSAAVVHEAGEQPYTPGDQSTLDALRALAESIGWTIRWRNFDASASDWKYTVFQPSRSKTAPDHTFAAASYWNVTQMAQAIEDIRNVVEVVYPGPGGVTASVVVTDSVSTGGAMTAASTTLTTTGGNTFAATDVGKTIKVPGAGAAGATLTSTIATRVGANEVTLAVAASTTVTGKKVLWGSIADHGRRYMKIVEGAGSPINNSTLATSLANAALSDLKEPDAILEVECRYFWPGEVGVDLYRFSANDKHFSSAQDLAPVAFRHRIAIGERPTTWITCRGKPSGGVLMWHRRIGNSLSGTTPADDLAINNLRETARSQTAVTYGWNNAGDIDEIWGWISTPAQPLASDPWAGFTGQPTVRLTGDTESYSVDIPANGLVTYVQLVPIGVRTNVVVRGESKRFTLQGEQIRLIQQATIIATNATQCTVRVAVANPLAGALVTVTPATFGLAALTPTGAQNIAANLVTASLATTGYVDWVVPRPAFAVGTGRVTFTASSTDRISDVDAVDIPEQGRDTLYAQCNARITATTATTVTVTVTATSLAGTPTVGLVGVTGSASLSSGHAAGTYTYAQNGADNVWVINRGALNAGAGQAQFRAVLTGYQSDDDLVTIEEQGRDTVPLLSRARVTSTSATQVVVRVAVADPYPQGANTVTVTYQDQGSGGVSPASGGTITPAATLTEAAGTYIDYTITRPAFSAGTGRVTFTAAAANRTSDSDALEIPAQERDTVELAVRASVHTRSATQWVVRVYAADPATGGTGDVSVAYVTVGATVAEASPVAIASGSVTTSLDTTGYAQFTVTRPAFQTGDGRVTFTATRTGRAAGVDAIDVSAQERDTVELLCRTRVQSTSATQVVFRVAVADYVSGGSGDVTLSYTAAGCTINAPASPQTIASASVTADIDTTGTVDVTVDRAAFQAGTGRITFTATRVGRVPATDSGDVPSQDGPGPVMDVVGASGATEFTLTYTSTGTLTYSVDGAAYGAVPASPFTVSRNAAGGADKVLTFKCTRNSQTVTSMITIPPQVGTSATPPIVNNVRVTGVNNVTDEITVAWTVENLGSYTMDLDWSLGGTYHGANAITTLSNKTSPYVHSKTGTGGHGLDLTSGGTLQNIYYQVVVKNGSTIMAMSEPLAYQVDHV